MAESANLKEYPDAQHFYYDVFEKIGYTKSLAEKRIQIYNNVERCGNLIAKIEARDNNHTHIVIAGSRGEGVGICLDSDFDILFIQRRVKCFERCLYFVGKTSYSATFELDFENVPSGYAKLRLLALHRRCVFSYYVKEALVQRNGCHYLSNNQHYIWIENEGFVKQPSLFTDIAGPAKMINVELPNVATLHSDFVQAIPCAYPSLVDSWCTRERRNDWPSADLIEMVKSLDVLVVPTGVSDSFEEDLQWRLSMTLAEQALVRSFNDVQIKIYAAMKMLVKYELKPLCENITSYIVKNIVFWVFERKQLNYTKAGFIVGLRQCLEFLKFCVYWRYLPNYMIPEKNMFECKISGRQKTDMIKRLHVLIEECPHTLLRCPLVREMYVLPRTEIQRKLVYRELVEQVFLSVFSICPADYAVLEKKIFRHFSRDKIVTLVRLVFSYIIPLMRRTNPYGFFTLLESMTNDEICNRLLEGSRLGYLKR